ncbi:MAG: hypothetical protein AAFY17_05850 [Cyanobacteria bacterium J06642_11]
MINRPVNLRHAVNVSLITICALGVWLFLPLGHIDQPVIRLSDGLFGRFRYFWLREMTNAGSIMADCSDANANFLTSIATIPPSFHIYNQTLVLLWLLILSLLVVIAGLLFQMYRYRRRQVYLLQEQEERYHDLTCLGNDLFWELDQDLSFSYLSGHLHTLNFRDLKGKKPYQVLTSIPNLEADWDSFRELLDSHQPLENFTLRLHTSDTTLRIFTLNARPLFDKTSKFKGYRGLQREMTEEYTLTQTIAYQTHYG